MRQYLISGFFTYAAGQVRPTVGTATLQPHEVMDPATVAEVERILLAENNRFGTIATSMRVTGFQPYEVQGDREAPALHLNAADSGAMPPVRSPLLIEIEPGVVVPATRTEHVAAKGDALQYVLPSGGVLIGRFRWTHA